MNKRDEGGSEIMVGMLTGIGDSLVKLHVKNLASCINDEELRFIFEGYGKVKLAYVKTDVKKESVGFGFVTYLSPEDANKVVNVFLDLENVFWSYLLFQAKSSLDGEKFYGKKLSVNFCQEKHHREAYLLAVNQKLVEEPAPSKSSVQGRILSYSKSFDLSGLVTNKASLTSPSTRGTTPVSEQSFSSFFSKTPPPIKLSPLKKKESFPDYAMQVLHTPIVPVPAIDKKSFNSVSKTPPSRFQGPFIQDKFLLKDVLVSKIELECKQFVDLIVKKLMHKSTYELNIILKNPDSLRVAVKDEMRNIVFV